MTKAARSISPRTSAMRAVTQKPAGEQAISAALYQQIRAAVRELQTLR
jgi:hypothetical protein